MNISKQSTTSHETQSKELNGKLENHLFGQKTTRPLLARDFRKLQIRKKN